MDTMKREWRRVLHDICAISARRVCILTSQDATELLEQAVAQVSAETPPR
jgi:hypothetical protein